MKNKTLTKNMPNVKWHAIPPVRGPNPQGVKMKNFLRLIKSHGDRAHNIVNGFLNKHHGLILLIILYYLARFHQG